MQPLVRLTRILAATGGIAALAFAAGCSCGSSSADPDGAVTVDAPGDPDAEPDPVLLRSGTIALFENATQVVIGDNVVPLAIGATVSITMTDEETRTVFPLDLTGDGMPDSQVGGCAVTVYTDMTAGDPQELEPDRIDEGPWTISGTGNGTFVCAFGPDPLDQTADDRYSCRSTHAAAGPAPVPLTSTAAPLLDDSEVIEFTIAGADFSGGDYRGMLLLIGDFPDPAANGAFPLRGLGGTANELEAPNLKELAALTTMTEVGGYQTLVGEEKAPLPITHGGFTTFLDDGDEENGARIGIMGGDDSDILDTINITDLRANGEGLTLRASGDFSHPGAIPTDGRAVSFGCQGEACGPSGGGTLNALIISGKTTDGVLPDQAEDQFGTAMPDPVDSYATFTCSIFGAAGDGSREATLTAEAMAAILGTGATRIQTTVGHVGGIIVTNAEGTSSVNVLVGHSITGFTTVPPAD